MGVSWCVLCQYFGGFKGKSVQPSKKQTLTWPLLIPLSLVGVGVELYAGVLTPTQVMFLDAALMPTSKQNLARIGALWNCSLAL